MLAEPPLNPTILRSSRVIPEVPLFDRRPEREPRATLTTAAGSGSWIAAEYRGQRALNCVLGSVGLILAAPVMALIALVVKLTSPGPVIYYQVRIGWNERRVPPGSARGRRRFNGGGRPFVMYKFRTMTAGAEKQTGPVWATPDDFRVTKVGRFLRRFRLDELPQFYNVIKGDMNIVGPRPERPAIFGLLRHRFVEYAERQYARPGITGWAQVNRQYDTSLDDVREKLRFDLEYLQERTLLTDLRIMLLSLPAVLFRCQGW
jgi:lipopolysaccharide/colanic/teichoic acid biosynthesis glycosyltransferase